MNEIEKWYDEVYDEWHRLDRHRVEFDITKRYLNQYIQGDNLRIFDIGGGPGRYSIYLAEKGHRVTLLDLSGKNIEVGKEKAAEAGVVLEDAVKGNALDLSEYESEAYDVVLLMGPLYHLINEEDRRKAIENAVRLLKKDGILIVAFISKYAPIQDALLYCEDDFNTEELLNYLRDGINDEDKGFTTAYFTGIEEAKELMKSFDLTELAFVGVENILGSKEAEIIASPHYEKWIDIAYALSQDEKVYGTSQHLLYIGKK